FSRRPAAGEARGTQGRGSEGSYRVNLQVMVSRTFESLFLPLFCHASSTSFSRPPQAIPKASRYHFWTTRPWRARPSPPQSFHASSPGGGRGWTLSASAIRISSADEVGS